MIIIICTLMICVTVILCFIINGWFTQRLALIEYLGVTKQDEMIKELDQLQDKINPF